MNDDAVGGGVGYYLKTGSSELRPLRHRRRTVGNGSIRQPSRPQIAQQRDAGVDDVIGAGPSGGNIPARCSKVLQDNCGAELSHNGDMVTLETLRAERREEILRLAERRGAHSLRVFGSVARGEANENSDLDLLVAWEPGRSLLDHAGLVQDLQEFLGMKVHVGTEKSLHWYVRDRILREATPL
jgi:predicted nucleotidyltransferase